jgi:hypothetical protein
MNAEFRQTSRIISISMFHCAPPDCNLLLCALQCSLQQQKHTVVVSQVPVSELCRVH